MSRNLNTKKKSTKKYLKFKSLPLIPIIAIVEVLVLVVVSTYAWFYLSTDKQISVGTISVDADSGLDIDFKYAKEEDYINIWKYVDKDFEFEPVTSLDGRNFYVPTTGTMDNTSTANMVFREGTVNDINSKYINIDFEMTNTTDYDMKVYLNNNSYFNVKNKTTGVNDESRALRLAFYPNDASVGNVTSQLIGGSADYSGNEEHDTSGDTNLKTIYFDNTKWENNQASKNWDKVYAYIWNSNDNTGTEYHTAWPGIEMSRTSGPIYSLAFSDTNSYNKVIFNNGSGTQTATYNLTNNYQYTATSSGSAFTSKTVYFVKPNTWDNVYVHAWRRSNNTDQYYTSWPSSGDVSGLDEMKYVGSGIYSYTFSSSVYGILFTNGTQGGTNQTVDITSATNDKIYFVNGTSDGKYTVTTYGKNYSALTTKTVFFYNSLGWSTPYAYASLATSPNGVNTIEVAMTSLTGNVYYCNLPEIYSNVYFGAKENTAANRTVLITYQDGYVYRTIDTKTGTYYNVDSFQYSNYTSSNGYAVISPGVSAGFQRSYTPVVAIDNATGAATQVIPAFSNSIDNYIFGNTAGAGGASQTVFDIESKHVLSLSMVIWLEGTDPACYGDTYPGNNIELRLEFASSYTNTSVTPPEVVNVNTYGSETYTYKFYDKTREVWTSDRQSTESGVTVAPVMQLYDNTAKRGYLMHPDTYVTVDGKTKVSCWTVDAPQTVATKGHDIIFRRVNPYDEDEVWNYWHAGPVSGNGISSTPPITDKKDTTTYPIYSIAQTGTGTISFTAFSDGGPTEEILVANGGNNYRAGSAEVPEVSCGGLWGNHSVRTLTVVDGFSGHPCRMDSGMETISYSYKYSSSSHNRTVKIEYKASGPNNDIFYYFIVPDALYTATDPVANAKGLRCTFKNYYDYTSQYATNSDRNTLKYRVNKNEDDRKYYYAKVTPTDRDSVSTLAPSGDYFMFNETAYSNENNHTKRCYWGSDLLYVATTNKTSDYMLSGSDKDLLLQVEYSNNGNSTFYSYLFNVDDGDIKGEHPSAYVSVVPNHAAFNQYKLMSVQWSSPTNHKYSTAPQTITNGTNETISFTSGGGSNYSMRRNHLNNQNYTVLDHMYIRLYVSIQQNSALLSGQSPKIYLWDGNTNNGWPGQEMNYDELAYGYHRYYFDFDVPQYTKFKITKNGDPNTQSQNFTGTLNPECNYNVYRIDGTGAPYYDTNIASYKNADKTRTCAVDGPNATALPHYAVRTP